MIKIVQIECPECDAEFPVSVDEIKDFIIVSCPDCEYENGAHTFKVVPNSYEEA